MPCDHAAMHLALDHQRIDDHCRNRRPWSISRPRPRRSRDRSRPRRRDSRWERPRAGCRPAIETSSEVGTPSGRFGPARSRSASSSKPIERSVPAMVKRPSPNSMSAAAASSTCAGDLLAVLDHLVARLRDGRAARHDRARAAGAAARDQLIAVALHQADALERNAEPLRPAPARRARRGPGRNRACR